MARVAAEETVEAAERQVPVAVVAAVQMTVARADVAATAAAVASEARRRAHPVGPLIASRFSAHSRQPTG